MSKYQVAHTMNPAGKAVVITGASTGLGRECALHLERSGFRVYAGVRKSSDGERLVSDSSRAGLHPVILDVTDEDSIREAARRVSQDVGDAGLWALINNAGTCLSAPLECVPPERMRRELDTNVVGLVRVTQAFLPLLRTSRGRIVNVSSGLGAVASPYLGTYAAGQFAKEALSDALRRELRPFGVTVSVIRAGAILTPIWDKVSETAADVLGHAADDVANLYRESFRRFLAMNDARARATRTNPADFARTIERALVCARPKTRYFVGTDSGLASLAARAFPDALIDRLFRDSVQGP